MITIPAPAQTREEWPDADFDFPEDETIHRITQVADRDDDFDDTDWDVEMDLGQTGGAKVKAVVDGLVSRPGITKQPSTIINVRPPIHSSESGEDEDEEGISTIKVATIPTLRPTKPTPPVVNEDDDIEDAFSLPHDMTQLSLRPLSLHHQSSKGSLEWGDKDQSSSQSSDTYSNLGLHDGSASSTYTSASQPETDTDEDEEDQLDGLLIPSGLFDKGARKLNRILELKKNQPAEGKPKVASPHPEDDFEIGLVIGDDVDLSPSRLLQNTHHPKRAPVTARSKSMPSQPSVSSLRPPSRVRERAKSPVNPPPSSIRQFRALAANPTVRTQSYSEALTQPPPSGTFLTPKAAGSLRGQKSHSGFNPSPASNQRRLGRKASLPTLSDPNQPEASGSGSNAAPPQSRYETTTASSRAKSQTTSRAHGLEHLVPPTRPSTPSSNPAALRLTMPTSSSRLKARPPVSAVFSNRPPSRSNSPLIPRPPSSLSLQQPKPPTPSSIPGPIKVLKRPKRPKVYGDGTELDAFDDLPLDGEKETRFRVQPKVTRVPGASYPKPPEKDSSNPKGTLRRKPTRESSSNNLRAESKLATPVPPLPTNSLRRKGRIDSLVSKPPMTEDVPSKKKRVVSSSTTKKKPHLIRNPGGASTPKVVGEMKWNPTALRWEGNDQALRDFDAVGTSARPALITHLTSSSIGSPVGSFGNGARIVGNMIFDSVRMCWISTLPPEEDEPDVFADLADDEEDGWETKGGTIRANQPSSTTESVPTSDVSDTGSGSSSRIEPASPPRSLRRRSSCESSSDRGSRASLVYDVDENFLQTCRDAEARHKSELKGWKLKSGNVFDQTDRSYLWEIRALATRRY